MSMTAAATKTFDERVAELRLEAQSLAGSMTSHNYDANVEERPRDGFETPLVVTNTHTPADSAHLRDWHRGDSQLHLRRWQRCARLVRSNSAPWVWTVEVHEVDRPLDPTQELPWAAR